MVTVWPCKLCHSLNGRKSSVPSGMDSYANLSELSMKRGRQGGDRRREREGRVVFFLGWMVMKLLIAQLNTSSAES